MKRFATFSAFFVVLLTFIACDGYNVFGIDNNNANNTNNTNNSNNTQPELLTRGQLFQDLYTDIMAYSHEVHDATSLWSDVDHNTTLAWALRNLHAIGHLGKLELQDGNFHPNQEVLNVEVWSIVVQTIGFVGYEFDCTDGIEPGTWFYTMAETLCQKRLLDSQTSPAEIMTVEEWELMKADIAIWMSWPATRSHVWEAATALLLKEYSLDNTEKCTSYEDIVDDSFLCHLTELMIENMGMDSDQTNARPSDSVGWTELNKFMFVVPGITPEVEYSGSSGTPEDNWGVSYNDSIASRDGLHPEFEWDESVGTIQHLYQAMWLFHSRFLRETKKSKNNTFKFTL